MKTIRGMVLMLSGLLLGACSALGIRSGTEQPDYRVVDTIAVENGRDIEIRRYDRRLAAEVTVSGDEEGARSDGFRVLADYIFGENREKADIPMTAPVAQAGKPRAAESIAMTAPVAQEKAGPEAWTVRFFMPSRYTRETLPDPVNPEIDIVEVPAETMAALRFSGARGAAAVEKKTRSLLQAVESSDWTATGPPVAWFYDPPWTPASLRRNEVAVPVAPARQGSDPDA